MKQTFGCDVVPLDVVKIIRTFAISYVTAEEMRKRWHTGANSPLHARGHAALVLAEAIERRGATQARRRESAPKRVSKARGGEGEGGKRERECVCVCRFFNGFSQYTR